MESELIRDKILSGKWAMSRHARLRAGQRKIRDTEIIMAIADGEIIEDYPEDSRGHSCLVLGYLSLGRPLHAVCGMDPSYFPEPPKWLNERNRGKGD